MAAEKETTKTAALAKGKRTKMIFIILISLLIAALITWAGLKLFKKWKTSRILKQESTGSGSGSGSSSISAPPAGTGSNGLETIQNVKAIQSAINKAHPEAALDVDGIMGPLTMGAIKKYYGADAYPLTQASMTKIISGVSPIGFPAASGSASENDDFPLKIGSSGNLVTAIKRMMNGINPKSALNDKSDQFDQALYNAIITYAGVSYYPVTYDNYIALNNLYNKAKAA